MRINDWKQDTIVAFSVGVGGVLGHFGHDAGRHYRLNRTRCLKNVACRNSWIGIRGMSLFLNPRRGYHNVTVAGNDRLMGNIYHSLTASRIGIKHGEVYFWISVLNKTKAIPIQNRMSSISLAQVFQDQISDAIDPIRRGGKAGQSRREYMPRLTIGAAEPRCFSLRPFHSSTLRLFGTGWAIIIMMTTEYFGWGMNGAP